MGSFGLIQREILYNVGFSGNNYIHRPKIAILLIKVEIIALESIFESVNF